MASSQEAAECKRDGACFNSGWRDASIGDICQLGKIATVEFHRSRLEDQNVGPRQFPGFVHMRDIDQILGILRKKHFRFMTQGWEWKNYPTKCPWILWKLMNFWIWGTFRIQGCLFHIPLGAPQMEMEVEVELVQTVTAQAGPRHIPSFARCLWCEDTFLTCWGSDDSQTYWKRKNT